MEQREDKTIRVELEEAYEKFEEAVTTATKTGDISQLHESATGSQLQRLLETMGAEEVPPWWGPEIREYSNFYAEVSVTSHRSDWIVRFERVDDTWKVSSIKSQPST